MNFRLVESLSEAHVDQLVALYQGEWWSRRRTVDEVRVMLRQGDLVFGFVDLSTDQLVGFARVLTDRVYKAMIFDVIIRPDHRGGGLGRDLLDAIVNHPVLRNVAMIELYCLPDLVSFYERWGFSTDVAGCVLMRRLQPTPGAA